MRVLVVGVMACLMACATTQVRGTWVASEQPSWNRVLVVGMASETTWARSFESSMAERLRDAGLDAVPLSEVEVNGLRDKTAEESRAEIERLVSEDEFDAVLIGHLSGVEVEVEPYLGPSLAFGPWWGHAWGGWWYGPGYGYPYFGYAAPPYFVDRTWRVETRLFDARADRHLLWSMVLTTYEEPLRVIPKITGETMKQLQRRGLVQGQ